MYMHTRLNVYVVAFGTACHRALSVTKSVHPRGVSPEHSVSDRPCATKAADI